MAKFTRRLDKQDRRELAKQLINTGHLTVGGLLFKQIFSAQPFNAPLGIVGALVLASAYVVALILMRKGGED